MIIATTKNTVSFNKFDTSVKDEVLLPCVGNSPLSKCLSPGLTDLSLASNLFLKITNDLSNS